MSSNINIENLKALESLSNNMFLVTDSLLRIIDDVHDARLETITSLKNTHAYTEILYEYLFNMPRTFFLVSDQPEYQLLYKMVTVVIDYLESVTNSTLDDMEHDFIKKSTEKWVKEAAGLLELEEIKQEKIRYLIQEKIVTTLAPEARGPMIKAHGRSLRERMRESAHRLQKAQDDEMRDANEQGINQPVS